MSFVMTAICNKLDQTVGVKKWIVKMDWQAKAYKRDKSVSLISRKHRLLIDIVWLIVNIIIFISVDLFIKYKKQFSFLE